MDNLKKNLADRKKDRENLQTMLNSLYRECGEAQFEYVLQRKEPTPHIDEQDFEAWKMLRESRRKDSDTILSIKTAQSRQNELKVFSKEVDKLLHEQQRTYQKTRNDFILLFFQTYQNNSLPQIAHIAQSIEPLKESIEKVQQEKQELEHKKNDAHFFKKLTLSPQLLSLKNKLTSLQKKMNEQIIEVGEESLTDEVIKEVRGASFPEQLETAYLSLQAIVSKQDEMENRKETLNTEQKKLEETLTECGVADTPQKRINILTDIIKNTDEKIEEAERQQGSQYSDIFYTEAGEKTDEPLTGIPELFKPYLDAIAEYRVKLGKNAIDIEYIENEIALAGEVHKIETLQKAIAGYREGITQYEKLIETAEQDIAREEEIKLGLEERNNELKSQGSAD
ncbi:hypothetical protein C5N99_07670 [Treponema medium]|uniref:hypothetical protein n=1 Tax=Treponema medium TaxID=58231 RepID=UPI00197CF65D|nr:hypothetical protein [Treponema medium]QSH92341.1 hypothetical protein C5N99_06950 [Treponema medium]QSH92478.1 hypothetical protein C5N99_07670 [Treponema medium]